MVLIDSLVTFADKVKTILTDNQESLGLHSIYYGDQNKLPGTPIACVEPDLKTNDLAGATRSIEIKFVVQILVYSSLVDSNEVNRRGADVLAEQIETLLHQDPYLGSTVMHSMVESIQSGYTTKSGTLVRASKIQFAALSKVRLPSA